VEQPGKRIEEGSVRTSGVCPKPYARLALCVLSLCWLVCGTAKADDANAATGLDLKALPGVHEVPLAVSAPEGIAARAGFGYGWTEAVLKMKDSHHRMQLDAAASYTPLPWLSTALRVLGRYDLHAGGENDGDYGFVTGTHLTARTVLPLGTDFQAGAELDLWLPGGDSVGKAFSALSGDLALLLAYAPQASGLRLGLMLGLRLDRSRYGGGEPDRYSPADRLALGVSDALWAARPGVAFAYRSGSVEWLAEWAYRMYFEYAGQSPMWIRAGARYWPSDNLQLELLLGVSPSQRPSLAQDAPLTVVEPRAWAGVSATYAWRSEPPPPEVVAPPPPPPEPEPEPRAALHGQVLAQGGAALPGANVSLSLADNKQELQTDAQGRFSFDDLEPGEYQLAVSAEGFEPAQRSVLLQPKAAPELSIPLTRELPIGQIRGTVRRFDGKPILARVVISALNIDLKTRDDGTFEIDVPPGDYAVVVSADRFKRQTRTAHVEQRGVAILIVELEPRR
jgi:hypothetical protein